MYCKHCMRQIEDDALICPACGKSQKKAKRAIYKRWWFWCIIIAFLFVSCMGGSSNAPQTTDLTKDECMLLCSEIDYATLARNPESHAGTFFRFTGEVVQAMEGSGYWNLRLNITPVPSFDGNEILYYEDTIFVAVPEPEDGSRILEGDIITIYGQCVGLQTYESILGAEISIPRMDAYYFDIES